jgi:hypothetical protein
MGGRTDHPEEPDDLYGPPTGWWSRLNRRMDRVQERIVGSLAFHVGAALVVWGGAAVAARWLWFQPVSLGGKLFVASFVFVYCLGGTVLLLRRVREIFTERRRDSGQCLQCGYDLRATPGRCPECGAIPEPAKPEYGATPIRVVPADHLSAAGVIAYGLILLLVAIILFVFLSGFRLI